MINSPDTQEQILITKIAIIGGGPAGLAIFRELVRTGNQPFEIHIYEKTNQLGSGMPYSNQGANREHVTNVSSNEIPKMEIEVLDWLKTQPKELLEEHHINPEKFSEYQVLPRLLFGLYLKDQFDIALQKARSAKIDVKVFYHTAIEDIQDNSDDNSVAVITTDKSIEHYDHVIICTGHVWKKSKESEFRHYFDSPYPPSKLQGIKNKRIAIRGASLTAIDAVRTVSRTNGFFEDIDGKLMYHLNEDCQNFQLTLHTRNGLLPAVRFHLDDSHLHSDRLLTEAEIARHMEQNDGFLSLDYLFDNDFKKLFIDKDPLFYELIKDMTIEEFVDKMLSLRESPDPFQLLREEYYEAAESIRRKKSIYWKEALAILSFAMNYPAKHFSAEDMLRLQKELKPLISVVIAFIPQASCREILALHDAGLLNMIAVGNDSNIEVKDEHTIHYNYVTDDDEQISLNYDVFIDCIGQAAMQFDDFPFPSLISDKSVNPAFLRFRDQSIAETLKESEMEIESFDGHNYYLKVPGVAIGDDFHLTDKFGANNPRIAIMAVPYIAGFNPDYSGLDFCEAASEKIAGSIFKSTQIFNSN